MESLTKYFTGVASKYLSTVEANRKISNQHELNGIKGLVPLLGETGTKKHNFRARCVYLDDNDNRISDDGELTWYDSRLKIKGRKEDRLYYQDNAVFGEMSEGDFLALAMKPDGTVVIIVTPADSMVESQVRWLLGIPSEINTRFTFSTVQNEVEMNFTRKNILSALGIEIESADDNYLDMILGKYGVVFPKTREFSRFARELVGDEVDGISSPDQVLMEWLNFEEVLFRTLEKHIVEEKLKVGFKDVDEFVSYSLSIHNTRKSRIGYAFENHLEEIFKLNSILYSRGQVTEFKSKPDFIFPGIDQYKDPEFSASNLTMLGVKSTCKDRWRQVLVEAERLTNKNLITLEAGISIAQTTQMQAHSLQLIVPIEIQQTYKPEQANWLISLSEFMGLVSGKQKNI